MTIRINDLSLTEFLAGGGMLAVIMLLTLCGSITQTLFPDCTPFVNYWTVLIGISIGFMVVMMYPVQADTEADMGSRFLILSLAVVIALIGGLAIFSTGSHSEFGKAMSGGFFLSLLTGAGLKFYQTRHQQAL